MQHFKTVLGSVPENEIGITLPHEHICCYSEYLYTMAGNAYLPKEYLIELSVKYLKEFKSKYGLTTFIDCTPVNIGRDVTLLKTVSKQSGVNIICATGFYHTQEPLLGNLSADYIANCIIADAMNANAGIIKCAVEGEIVSSYDEKILKATAKAQLVLGLPIVLHSNANNKNGLKALEILLTEGVKPQAITVGHLSDTEDLEYVKQIAENGCFIGLDRLYDNCSQEYISKLTGAIVELCDAGYEDKILLSHDALFFNGFEANPFIREKPRFSYCFDHILPKLSNQLAERLMTNNPFSMLKCGE